MRHSILAFMACTTLLFGCGGGGGGGGGGVGGGGGAATPPAAPTLNLTPQAIKTFHFTWTDVSGETEYRLLENPDGSSGYTQVATIAANAASHDLIVSLPKRINARYILQACNGTGCSDSAPVLVNGTLAAAVGYVKASNTRGSAFFGYSIALSSDGNTLAVGAEGESSNATGVNGDQTNTSLFAAGAVYVFTRSGNNWSQQAYLKASNTGDSDQFGYSIAISGNGNTLVVGAAGEPSAATGINGNQADNTAQSAGAVYVFSRSGGNWSQQAYVKASNTGASDLFGYSIALSTDGNTLAVGAYQEDSNATGINGDQTSNGAAQSGAVYVFTRSVNTWSQQAYVKASNTGISDQFGRAVALSSDGNTLAVGAAGEFSNAIGINGDQTSNGAGLSGAVYVFTRNVNTWSQQAYVKASNTGADDFFGWSVALAGDGNTLAVGSLYEDSNATGINGNSADNSALSSGAVYIFSRSGSAWSQQAYVKASITEAEDLFGASVAISADGNTLAVGAGSSEGHVVYRPNGGEDSGAVGINGNQADNSAGSSGAVYVFTRSGIAWTQKAYVKAPNTVTADFFGSVAHFGHSVSLSSDGAILAAGAPSDDSGATGIGGNQSDNSAISSGAVYLY